jgi:RNA polymerase sigma-70 factor (ECF subfamily)
MSEPRALIQRWQAGDEHAAEAIYNRYRDETSNLANVLLDDRADAEEVVQDALMYALTHIDRYDPQRARFSTWLHTVTVSRCRNKRRRRILPGLSLFSWRKKGGDAPDPNPGPERRAMQAATRDEVWEAIQTLSQPLREALVLRHWGNYTYQEIGDILDCSLRTAQSRVRLAQQHVEKSLTKNDVLNLAEKSDD